jgi:hypothetical protein
MVATMTPAMRSFDAAERRARLGLRHHLAPIAGAADVLAAARGVVALHATDPATIFLSARARVGGLSVADVEGALYEERTLVRVLAMRRTMFVMPDDLAPVTHAAVSRALAPRERRRLLGMLREAGVTDRPEAWLADVERSTLLALAARGEATASELGRDEPRLRLQIPIGVGKPYESRVGVSTRLLFLLATEGRVVRGRPRGSWISSQYRWSLIERWLPDGLPPIPADVARARLAERWLAAFGPGTVADLRWWTGWPLGQTRDALRDAGDVVGFVLSDDLEPTPPPAPWVAFLPALDATVMGWTDRRWFLGEHGPALFDRNGNAGPTVWWDGRVVGAWSQRPGGAVAFLLLEDVGAEATASIGAEAERLDSWLGGVRVTPRFRTPIERALADQR